MESLSCLHCLLRPYDLQSGSDVLSLALVEDGSEVESRNSSSAWHADRLSCVLNYAFLGT